MQWLIFHRFRQLKLSSNTTDDYVRWRSIQFSFSSTIFSACEMNNSNAVMVKRFAWGHSFNGLQNKFELTVYVYLKMIWELSMSIAIYWKCWITYVSHMILFKTINIHTAFCMRMPIHNYERGRKTFVKKKNTHNENALFYVKVMMYLAFYRKVTAFFFSFYIMPFKCNIHAHSYLFLTIPTPIFCLSSKPSSIFFSLSLSLVLALQF